MIKYFYLYEVEYYEEACGKILKEKGFIQATDYYQAMALIGASYGEGVIEFVNIAVVPDSDGGPLTVSMIIDMLGSDLHKHEMDIDEEDM